MPKENEYQEGQEAQRNLKKGIESSVPGPKEAVKEKEKARKKRA